MRERAQSGLAEADKVRQAWEELYIAEGSDWFWWYGDDHSCAQDELFDYLFRKHLQNIYTLLGDEPPAELARPICKRVQRPTHSMPRSFLDVKIDGRVTFFEWINAGRYPTHNLHGTMTEVTTRSIRELLFGFNREALLIRVDAEGQARQVLGNFTALRVVFAEPAGWELVVPLSGDGPCMAVPWRDGQVQLAAEAATIKVGLDKILEMAVPFDLLGIKVGDPVQFFVEVLEGDQSRDRAPREGTIQLTRPGADFEQRMWDV